MVFGILPKKVSDDPHFFLQIRILRLILVQDSEFQNFRRRGAISIVRERQFHPVLPP